MFQVHLVDLNLNLFSGILHSFLHFFQQLLLLQLEFLPFQTHRVFDRIHFGKTWSRLSLPERQQSVHESDLCSSATHLT